MFELNADRRRVLETSGHMLILGGPGSGKSTIALLKGDHHIRTGYLKSHQHVLFLSFARPTVARVKQIATKLVSPEGSRLIEINTYHGFAWRLLRSHGYLLNGRRSVRLITPPEAAARFAGIGDDQERLAALRRLFAEEGVLHFDLFAELAGDLLGASTRLARIFSDAYPMIVLDEFQDTNSQEWRMIQTLGAGSSLIALADADQRIYEFRGADPKRIAEFIAVYNPTQFDFGAENNRSNGTDIIAFGNDLLTGANKNKAYNDIVCEQYRVLKGPGIHLNLKLIVLKAIDRLKAKNGGDWSLAVLVPTNQLMMDISDYLAQEQPFKNGRRLPMIAHDVAFDTSGPALAAALIARALEGGANATEIAYRLILTLRDHIRGRKGNDSPGQQQLALAGALDEYVSSGKVRGKVRKELVDECIRIASALVALKFSGDPGEDWLAVRRLLQASTSPVLRQVAEDAKYLRLLHRGSVLRARLSELWRSSGGYAGALNAVRDALVQEHFSNAIREWRGVHVMTIHKSKGKEFDEVIVYEGAYQNRIVYPQSKDRDVQQALRNLRVAVTRAKQRATVLTPQREPCMFL